MNASIGDLRYRMKSVLRALARGERVTILYRGKAKGILVPVETMPRGRVIKHPFFGMKAADTRSVTAEMAALRGGRFRAL
jgi:antitoxin (DNA-binding transcriptional repressor) of toxin-antitoxin stability system